MDSGFRFIVEEIYSIPARGIVVTGRVEEGAISVGEEIGFLGLDGKWIIALVAAIEVSQILVQEVEAGKRASMLLQGIKKDQVSPGMVLLEVPEAAVPVSSPAPRTHLPPTPASPLPSYGEPIHPSSSLWRTLLFICIGILIILALFHLQGK